LEKVRRLSPGLIQRNFWLSDAIDDAIQNSHGHGESLALACGLYRRNLQLKVEHREPQF
jgi:hypothetical protein